MNVGATWEQTFGKKSTFEFSSVSTTAMGTKKEVDLVTKIEKGAAFAKWESKMVDRCAKVESVAVKMQTIGSKLSIFK